MIGNVEIKLKATATILGLLIDKKLSFKQHVNALCQKANFKTNTLKSFTSYLKIELSEAIYRSYIYLNFLSSPFI